MWNYLWKSIWRLDILHEQSHKWSTLIIVISPIHVTTHAWFNNNSKYSKGIPCFGLQNVNLTRKRCEHINLHVCLEFSLCHILAALRKNIGIFFSCVRNSKCYSRNVTRMHLNMYRASQIYFGTMLMKTELKKAHRLLVYMHAYYIYIYYKMHICLRCCTIKYL